MANLSDPNFFDAGTNPPRSRVVVVAGQRRIEKIPNGKVELWVNGAGVIVWQQIIQPGHPPAKVTEDREHAVIRRKPGNWVRLHRCPLQPGSQSTIGLSDFPAELQRACAHHDNKSACPHVRYLIKERATKHAADRKDRHALMRKRETERREAEARREQQQQELNESLLKLVGRVTSGDPPPAPTPNPPSSRGRGG